MSLSQLGAPAVSQTSLYALLSKNWGPIAAPTSVTFENYAVTAGVPITLLDTVNGVNNGWPTPAGIAPGPGVISSTWCTGAAPTSGTTNNMLDGLVQIYIDGEMTPSITFDLGGPLGWYQGSMATSYRVWTKNFSCENSSASTQALAYYAHNWMLPIPYAVSAKIVFTPSYTVANFFWNTKFVSLPQHFPFKLYSQVTTFDSTIGVYGGAQWTAAQLGNGTVKLLNVPGGSGYIAAAWLAFLSGTANLNTLNLDINTYLNGATPGTGYGTQLPTLTGMGIDGFFRWKNGGTSPYFLNQSAVSNATAANGTFHGLLDIATLDGCWRFTNGAVMQLESGQAGNGGNTASIAAGVLYYGDTQ